jgi:tRNA(Ile2) C34 agmatinyltransferase TiaS
MREPTPQDIDDAESVKKVMQRLFSQEPPRCKDCSTQGRWHSGTIGWYCVNCEKRID